MRFELLYFDGCPSWQTAYDHLKQVIGGLSLQDDVQLVHVQTGEQAVGFQLLLRLQLLDSAVQHPLEVEGTKCGVFLGQGNASLQQ